jgi:uncharacterized protein
MNAARASLLVLLLCWAFAVPGDVAHADVAVPPLVGRVVDQTGTLSASEVSNLNQAIRAFETRKGSQIAVLIVPTTDGEAIEAFSLRVAEAWKIGRKKIDDGALLVIAKNDRHLRIEVGYGLEGALTDVTSKRLIDEDITPKFKAGDFSGGVSAGVDRMIRTIDGEKLPMPEPPQWQAPAQSFDPSYLFNPFLIIPVLLFGGAIRSVLGRLVGSGVSGGLVALIAWFFFGSLVAALLSGLVASILVMFSEAITAPSPGGRSGRLGGGGSWSTGGGGRSDWSSSSSANGGGGGSFGGGGASGSW